MTDPLPPSRDAEGRAAFLRSVAASGFVPELSLSAGGPDPREDELRNRVEQFAKRLWSADPTQRSQQWQALHAEAATFPRVQVRLMDLKPAATEAIPAIPAKPKILGDLAREICELSVLPARDRATARAALVRQRAASRVESRKTAKRLKRVLPSVATLDPDYVHELVSLGRKPRRPRPAPPPKEARIPFGAWVMILLMASSVFRYLVNQSPKDRPRARWNSTDSLPVGRQRVDEQVRQERKNAPYLLKDIGSAETVPNSSDGVPGF